MLFTVLTQLLLPLGLVGLLAFAPLRGALELAVRSIAAATVLAALALAALWTVLPGSLVPLYGLLWLAAVAGRARSLARRDHGGRSSRLQVWIVTPAFVGLGLLGGLLTAEAMKGRRLPGSASVDISLPFEEGTFLVVNGGSAELINAHLKTLDGSVPRFRPFRGQSYGVDLVRIDRWGRRARGLSPSDPAEYAIFGTPVYAPCDGRVVAARGDRPDMVVPQMDLDVIEGNHVLLRCDGFDLLLAHLQHGTVRVESGDRVRAGELLGRVGNSGRSGEPHLHCSAQRAGTADEPFSGEPLFLTIDGRTVVRNDRIGAAPP